MKLYTYLPKENTALSEGLLSTVLSDNGFEKYRGRTGKYSKEDVLKVLDSWEPEWTRSKAISALTEPIPEDAAEDFLEFARNRRLYSFDTKDLIKAKILAHIRRARKGGGTDPVDEPSKERPNWHRKKKHLLFQGVPHYFVETTGGKIPPEFVTEEKRAAAPQFVGKNFMQTMGELRNAPQTASNPTDADIRAAFRVNPNTVRGHDTVPHFMASVENVNPHIGRQLWDMAKGRSIPRMSIFLGSTPQSLDATGRRMVEARKSWPNGVNTAYAAMTNMYDRVGQKTGRPVWDVANVRPTEYGKMRRGMSLRIK